MLVQLPEEQTQEIQKMIATLIKDEIHHFKRRYGIRHSISEQKTNLSLSRSFT